MQQIENFQEKYEKPSEHAWALYRVIAVSVFFGLLILFGVITGVLALIDRTPRLTATSTLFLLIWTGFVLLLGAGDCFTPFPPFSVNTPTSPTSGPLLTTMIGLHGGP